MAAHPVLMTGASGFIGQRIQQVLQDGGRTVAAIVRPDSPNASRILSGVRLVKSSLDDRNALAAACKDAEAVIYCAGTVRGKCLGDFKPANVDGVANLVEALNLTSRQVPFLLISSLAAERPELSDYARSKQMGEEVLQERARFPWTIFCPPAVYGPGDREMMPILALARRGLIARPGSKDQRLSLIHADDLARAVRHWLDAWPRCSSGIFTLDDGRPGGYAWPDIARAARQGRHVVAGIPRPLLRAVAALNLAFAHLFGYAPMLTPGKVGELTQDAWLCDNTPLTEATGWTPEIDLERGIRQLFVNNGTADNARRES